MRTCWTNRLAFKPAGTPCMDDPQFPQHISKCADCKDKRVARFDFLDVEGTSSSTNSDIIFDGRRFESGRRASIALVGLCLGNMFHNLMLGSGQRHSLTHSVGHLSQDLVDRVRPTFQRAHSLLGYSSPKTTRRSLA